MPMRSLTYAVHAAIVFAGGVVFFSVLPACHQSAAAESENAFVPDAVANKVRGVYTGKFNKGYITLEVNYIKGRVASGYNIHKGLRRNINGPVSQHGGQLDFVLNEPGDNPYDGVFYFSIDTNGTALKGRWVPKDSTKMGVKTLDLTHKRTDKYDGEDIWTLEGDTTLTFNGDGTCEYAFYERPEDSTSQQITVRGNYEQKKDTFRIEWEKNKHTPAQAMKLVIHFKRTDDGDSIRTLKGHGLEFGPFIGD